MIKDLKINSHGGILIDPTIVIDGHEDVRFRVVTHAHSDHLVMLKTSLNKGLELIGTPLTLEWIEVLGYSLNPLSIKPLNYGERLRLGDGVLWLEKAEHIPGTAQVVYERSDGLRIVYTSDFKKPGKSTKIISGDILITDAVYGSPSYKRPFDDWIDVILTDLVKELLVEGPVHIYGYHGKIQEVMALLRREGLDTPYILTHKEYLLAKAAEKAGLRLGSFFHERSEEAEEIIRGRWYIHFHHMNARKKSNGCGSHVVLSGWEFSKPFKRLGQRRWLVAFSDHADFNGLVDYVVRARPRKVLVNNSRSTYGELFVEYLRRKHGIDAYLLP